MCAKSDLQLHLSVIAVAAKLVESWKLFVDALTRDRHLLKSYDLTRLSRWIGSTDILVAGITDMHKV